MWFRVNLVLFIYYLDLFPVVGFYFSMILGAKKMQFSGFQPPSVTKHVRLAAAQVVVQGSLDWSSGKIYWKPFFPMKHKGFHFPFHQSIEWFMNLWCSMFRVLLILNMFNLSVKDLDIAHQTFQFYNKKWNRVYHMLGGWTSAASFFGLKTRVPRL